MIDIAIEFLASIDWVIFTQIYIVFGLIVLLILINLWRNTYGPLEKTEGTLSGMDNRQMTNMVIISLLAWPYIVLIWIASWPVFSWAFWLRPISVKIPSPWWLK